jgi:hypothetical protein
MALLFGSYDIFIASQVSISPLEFCLLVLLCYVLDIELFPLPQRVLAENTATVVTMVTGM